MSGTSGDGVDTSLIRSDGENENNSYESKINILSMIRQSLKNIHHLKEKINTIKI